MLTLIGSLILKLAEGILAKVETKQRNKLEHQPNFLSTPLFSLFVPQIGTLVEVANIFDAANATKRDI